MTALFPSPALGRAAWPGLHIDRTELLAGFPSHDFEHFFIQHYDRLVRSLTAITGDPELARDCVQDAFVKASTRWRKLRRYDDPVAWVRRVAINRSRDIYRADERRRRRERTVGLDAGNVDVQGYAAAIDESLDLAGLLATLPAQQRTVAALFYIDDLRVADIAETLGLSTGTVKFHLSSARRTLRAVVEQEGHEDGYWQQRHA